VQEPSYGVAKAALAYQRFCAYPLVEDCRDWTLLAHTLPLLTSIV
jgi:hypothetical protein